MEPLKIFRVAIRELSEPELTLIMEKLIAIKNSGHPLYSHASPMFARKNLRDMAKAGQVAVISVDTGIVGIVVFDVVRQWFTVEPMVVEQLILQVNDRYAGVGKVAMGVLEGAAKDYGASVIIAGNSLGSQAVSNRYLKDGYRQFDGFIKEVDCV